MSNRDAIERLRAALQAAVDGEAHWRERARATLRATLTEQQDAEADDAPGVRSDAA